MNCVILLALVIKNKRVIKKRKEICGITKCLLHHREIKFFYYFFIFYYLRQIT